MDDLLTLITEAYTQNAIGEQIATETRVEVWAHIMSASRAEWYEGGKAGLQPAYVAETPIVNYGGQKLCEWRGRRYAIYRTYFRDGSDLIELYLEERAGVFATPETHAEAAETPSEPHPCAPPEVDAS